MTVRLSGHALSQLQERDGIASEREILQVISSLEEEIRGLASYDDEVKVVVKRSPFYECRDGSNGGYVVACVTTNTKDPVVKTVMLSRAAQIKAKEQAGLLYLFNVAVS